MMLGKRMMALLLVLLMGTSMIGITTDLDEGVKAIDFSFDIAQGNIIIEDGSATNTYKVTHGNPQEILDNIPQEQILTFSGTTSTNGVNVKSTFGTVRIKLSDFQIASFGAFNGMTLNADNDRQVELILEDGSTNIIKGHISNASTDTGGGLTITCEHANESGHVCNSSCGSLTVNGNTGQNGAGISGHNITIQGGNVVATGGNSSPGIGVYGGTARNIRLTGGNITATGNGSYGTSGIGGGDLSNARGIFIDGGIVTATGVRGSGIGSGMTASWSSAGQAHDIIINGGTVTASSNISGYGIGGSRECSNFQINGGSVNATSIKIRPVNLNGVNVYKTLISLADVAEKLPVTDVVIVGADYFGLNDVFTDTSGRLYFYLPEGAVVSSVVAGGSTYYGNVTTTADDLSTGSFGVPACQIEDQVYYSLTDGLNALEDGDILSLLRNVESKTTFIYRKNFTLNLNGFVLNVVVSGSPGLIADGYDMMLAGSGEFNISSTGYGVHAYDGGSAEVTNITARTIGVNVTDPGSEIKVQGDIRVVDAANESVGLGIYVEGDYGIKSSVYVEGDVISQDGVTAYSSGEVTIDGQLIIHTARPYAYVDNVPKNELDYEIPTTKSGYYTYANGTSTFWLKGIVPTAPVITNQPANMTTTFNEITGSLALTATVENGYEIEYAWMESSDGVTTDGTIILGAEQTFAIPEGLIAGSHYYYCIIQAVDPATSLNNAIATNIAQVTVGQATPKYTLPTGISAKFGQSLSDVVLPENFTWDDPLDTSVGEPGAKTFMATYTPQDILNYRIITMIPIPVEIHPITLIFKNKEDASGVEMIDLGNRVKVPELIQVGVENVTIYLDVFKYPENHQRYVTALDILTGKGYKIEELYELRLMKKIDYLDGHTTSGVVNNQDVVGPLVIRIPISSTLAKMEDLTVAYVDPEDKTTMVGGSVVEVDGKFYIQFETTHFSDYAVVEAIKTENPKTGVWAQLCYLGIHVVLFGILFVWFKFKRRSMN